MTAPKLAYNVAQAAERCGVSEDFIKASIRSGRLRAKATSTKKGRVTGRYLILESALTEWLEAMADA